MTMRWLLSYYVTLKVIYTISLLINITATYNSYHTINAASSSPSNREIVRSSNGNVISSHFSFRRGTKVDNEVSDVNTMELCYQYLMQSDENKNGILSSEEYMAFIHRLSQKLQPTKIDPDDPTSSTAEKQHDDDIQHDMIRTNGNRLESIMVFNHLSHQTSMNMNQTSEVQQQEKQSAITKDTSTSTSCTSNASGEVDCSDSDITSIWLGNNPPHPEVKRQRLRYAKASEPLIWGDVFHLICDEVLLAMDLHTPQSLSFSRYGFAS